MSAQSEGVTYKVPPLRIESVLVVKPDGARRFHNLHSRMDRFRTSPGLCGTPARRGRGRRDAGEGRGLMDQKEYRKRRLVGLLIAEIPRTTRRYRASSTRCWMTRASPNFSTASATSTTSAKWPSGQAQLSRGASHPSYLLVFAPVLSVVPKRQVVR